MKTYFTIMPSKTLPHADHFEPVSPTQEPIDLVDLIAVDLATYNDGPKAREQIAQDILKAMTTQGFFYFRSLFLLFY